MLLPIIVGLLFLVAALVNTFGPDPNAAEAAAGYAIAFTLFLVWRSLRRQDREQSGFLEWLIENADGVRKGTASYNDTLITEQTELTQFEAAMSFLVISFKFRSPYYFVDDDATTLKSAGFSLCSLVFGWWGFPWGPIFTVSTFASNLRGGRKRTAGDLLDELMSVEKSAASHGESIVILTEEAARNAIRIMQERGFPPGSGLRLEVKGDEWERQYAIQYDDVPTGDARDLVGTSHGVTILVAKRDAPLVQGLTIDFKDGDYRFQEVAGRSSMTAHAAWDPQLDS